MTEKGAPVNSLAARLSILRKERGLTQEGLAEKLDTRQSTVQGWEAGRGPTIDGLVTLADFYGVDLRWLATGEGPRERVALGEAERQLEAIRLVLSPAASEAESRLETARWLLEWLDVPPEEIAPPSRDDVAS